MALPSSYVTPPDIGTAGSAGGSSLTQGSALPSITTTQSQATAAPSWYTDYLQGIAQQGQAAGQNAQFVGPTAQQQQSYNLANSNVGNWQPAMDTANGALTEGIGIDAPGAAKPYLDAGANTSVLGAAQPYLDAGTNPTYNTVDKYMSPYLNDVVGKIGDLAQSNFQKNIAPGTTAGFVGSGQFGSQRGVQALGQTMADYNQQTTGKQLGALQTGYTDAMTAAGADATRNLQAGQTAGTLAQDEATNKLQAGSTLGQLTNNQQVNLINAAGVGGNLAMDTQKLGENDVNMLNTLGTQQQQIEQSRQLFPLQMASQEAGLMQGAQVPVSTSSTYTGPIPGAYQASPLQTGAGLASLLYGTNGISSGVSGALSGLSGLLSGNNTPPLTSADYSNIASGNMLMNNPATGAVTPSGFSV